MKQTTNNRRRAFRASIEAAGIDINTDFFTLSFSDIAALDNLARVYRYRRPASFPGSLARAFYYSAQKAK